MIFRDLQFRAWSDTAFVYFDIREHNDFAYYDFYSNCESNDIEQYTGLKDKNGKEIYDGDIIQENLSFDNDSVDGIFKYKVYWNETMLCWSLEHIGNESIHDDLWECNSSVEVIGNIHENPDLLEVK